MFVLILGSSAGERLKLSYGGLPEPPPLGLLPLSSAVLLAADRVDHFLRGGEPLVGEPERRGLVAAPVRGGRPIGWFTATATAHDVEDVVAGGTLCAQVGNAVDLSAVPSKSLEDLASSGTAQRGGTSVLNSAKAGVHIALPSARSQGWSESSSSSSFRSSQTARSTALVSSQSSEPDPSAESLLPTAA